MGNTDILSEVFSTLRLQSNLYFEIDLRGEFSVQVPKERRRIRFHLVRQGDCWIRVPGCEPARLHQGDLAIVPNGTEQIISSALDTEPVALPTLIKAGGLKEGVLSHGENGDRVRLLCGYCQFDEAIDHPIVASLPPSIVLQPGELGTEPWTLTTIRLLSLESDLKGQGMAGILSRLLEIVFIQTVRRMAQADCAGAGGFMAALTDARISRVLHAMHGEPEVAWTVKGLAQVAGMSRGRFSHRFTQAVGTSPIDYLTTWRLMKARALLASSNLDMADIAERCGYRSVPSFSRRFKKSFGLGPGTFRRSTH